ncbi:ribosome maturation factor RimP [Nakamurella sp. UYEF19]|uniref:ribosome maturation factor RimP n=1 Tax=Nakamurella sp. UYEF19 TaxID=1756392 RepID=UPI0033952F28
MASADQARLRGVVEAVVTRAGYDLEDLTVVAAGRRRLLRVVIDRDAGVDLDDAATVSREISAELDELDAADPMGAAAYTLEVTSPGIGRPLSLPRHFRRARGRLLAITTEDGGSLLGRVRKADDDGVELLVGKSGTDPLTLAYPVIAKARVEVEFSAPSGPVLAALGEDTAQLFTQPDLDSDDEGPDDDEPDDDEPDDDVSDGEGVELDEVDEPDEEPDEDEAEDLTTP